MAETYWQKLANRVMEALCKEEDLPRILDRVETGSNLICRNPVAGCIRRAAARPMGSGGHE